uniref:uncharacterized protein LOC109955158 isoform X5 n=1 Tax=Monopterus albus TaxID=43700 RepID=UPI0009B4D45F|nr:uncharacterized protein LOC109955158 isoform X5 [Monopterus albus]
MGGMHFYVLWSMRDAPRQFISKSNRRCFQVHIPLPLPKQLVIFGLGEWKCSKTTISVEVLVSAEVPAQKIGTLTSQARCLTWEGEWSGDIITGAAERGRKGVYGKIVLTMCEPENKTSVLSSTPLVKRKCLFPEQHEETDLSSTLHQSTENEMSLQITPNISHLGDSVCYAEIQVNKIDTSDFRVGDKAQAWPKDETPRHAVIGKRGQLTRRAEDMDSLADDIDQVSTPKRRRLSTMNSEKETSEQIKTENREVLVSPTMRWNHTMCLSDPGTAILIGGQTADQNYCKDSLWKLELDNEIWSPMSSSASGPVPPCAQGHSATYDPDSKAVFVYGGLRERQCYRFMEYTAVKCGNMPPLARGFHAALPVSDNRILVGGGCSTIGALQDVHVFNTDTNMWSSVACPLLSSKPRAGHSMISLSCSILTDTEKHEQGENGDIHCTLLVFGGSNCSGTFYNDAVKCTVEIPGDK